MCIRDREIKTTAGIEVSDNVVTITQAGIYFISGQSSDGMIVVDYEGEDEVTLILNGLHLKSQTGPAVYIKKSGDANIFLVEHSKNFIADAKQYNPKFKEKVTGTIYSTADLDILGKGSLTVYGNYNDAIVSKDDLYITDATLGVHSVDDGIRGKDSLEIENANIQNTAKGDGLKSDNKESEEKSYIRIASTTMEISAGGDAITAQNIIDIESGDITISSSYEGIEARQLNIYDGSIYIRSDDDSLNVVDKIARLNNRRTVVNLNIYGGEITLFAGDDGIDSNGQVLIAGGVLTVFVKNTGDGRDVVDHDADFTIKGGEVIALGFEEGSKPSENSTQHSILLYMPDIQPVGTAIRIIDEDTEEELLHLTPDEKFRSILFSSPDLQLGGNYTFYLDDTVYTQLLLLA